MKKNKIIIAIDGYSSTGKSSFAKSIANKIGYVYIDTGSMYRAVTYYCMQNGIAGDVEKIVASLPLVDIKFLFNEETQKNEIFLNGKNVESQIRGIDVSNNVSFVSAIKQVRTKMVYLQQKMGKNKGVVMDGRDIGTVVFPNAELKIFMTADPEIRAMRRYKELIAKGDNITFEDVKKNILARDYSDTHRSISPLKKAEDAITLDNSTLTPDEQMIWFDKIFSKI